jgi:subtilisin family serine protease
MALRTTARLIALSCTVVTVGVAAQIGLPPVHLPSLPTTGLTGPVGQAATGAAGLGAAALTSLRRAAGEELIRRNRQLIEADPNGEPMLRGELLALDLSAEALERVVAAGFLRVGEQSSDGSDTGIDVLRVPHGMSTQRALRQLRRLEPDALFDYDHIYVDSASSADAASTTAATADTAPAPDDQGGGNGDRERDVRVGLIDGGVQLTHGAFHGASIVAFGCDGRAVPSAHGTAIASLLIGDAAPFHGAAPGAQLYAADVYCGQPTGGAVDAIAAAFGWLHAHQVPVINISLVGPDNLILRQVVERTIARGHIVVAAVGNDGPAAPPLYPAAYPGVVGVTAVDAHRHVLIEAERGAQVEFAAPGADMVAASDPAGYSIVRGTSFAAPLVAGLLAPRLLAPGQQGAQVAIASLAREAIHLGASPRDASYGLGLVAEGLRVSPDIMQVDRK